MSMRSREAVAEWSLTKRDPITGEPTKSEQQKLIALARVLGWEAHRVNRYASGAEDVEFTKEGRCAFVDFHGVFQSAYCGEANSRRRKTYLDGFLLFLAGEPCSCPDDELAEIHEPECGLA